MLCLKRGLLFYILVSVVHCLILLFTGESILRMISKATLMPVLAGIVICHKSTLSPKVFIALLMAVIMSWLGDVFLLFDHQYPVFFMLGLGSFLLAHLFYMILILPGFKPKPNYILLFILGVAGYALMLIGLLTPKLGNLKIPVYVYAAVLCGLLMLALGNMKNFKWNHYILLICGAAFFVASDSILAFQKFIGPLPLGGVLVMSTYLAAQGLLVTALLRHYTKKERPLLA